MGFWDYHWQAGGGLSLITIFTCKMALCKVTISRMVIEWMDQHDNFWGLQNPDPGVSGLTHSEPLHIITMRITLNVDNWGIWSKVCFKNWETGHYLNSWQIKKDHHLNIWTILAVNYSCVLVFPLSSSCLWDNRKPGDSGSPGCHQAEADPGPEECGHETRDYRGKGGSPLFVQFQI